MEDTYAVLIVLILGVGFLCISLAINNVAEKLDDIIQVLRDGQKK